MVAGLAQPCPRRAGPQYQGGLRSYDTGGCGASPASLCLGTLGSHPETLTMVSIQIGFQFIKKSELDFEIIIIYIIE